MRMLSVFWLVSTLFFAGPVAMLDLAGDGVLDEWVVDVAGSCLGLAGLFWLPGDVADEKTTGD